MLHETCIVKHCKVTAIQSACHVHGQSQKGEQKQQQVQRRPAVNEIDGKSYLW